jgi:putative ABC transport system permease protein
VSVVTERPPAGWRGLVGGVRDHRRDLALAPRGVPLAWRNIWADKRRLMRSCSAIGFAVLLMLVQLGLRGAFLDSALEIVRDIDGDIVLASSTKFRVGRKDAFSRRHLYAARAVPGVATARPIYGEWMTSIWKNPEDHKGFAVRVLAFDPDQPVFLIPEINARLEQLKQPDAVMVDSRARRFLGRAAAGSETELSRRAVRVVGTFALGPDFTTDGTVVMSDRNFLKFFSDRGEGDLADVELGVIKLLPGHDVERVQADLRRALPGSMAVLTKPELVDLETEFQSTVSPVGPIFTLGTAIGFIVGMLISYQVLYTDLSDHRAQYATLKAMGYENGYLVRVVVAQSAFYALVGFVPAWILGILLFAVVGELALLPLTMTPALTMWSLTLTLGMCIVSGLVAVRRVASADPADVF